MLTMYSTQVDTAFGCAQNCTHWCTSIIGLNLKYCATLYTIKHVNSNFADHVDSMCVCFHDVPTN